MPLHQVPKMSFTPANRVGSKQSIGGNVPIHQFSSFTALIMHGCCNSYQKSGLLHCDLTKKYVFHLHVDPQQSIVKSSVAAQKLETDRERERLASEVLQHPNTAGSGIWRLNNTVMSWHSWQRLDVPTMLTACMGLISKAPCSQQQHCDLINAA